MRMAFREIEDHLLGVEKEKYMAKKIIQIGCMLIIPIVLFLNPVWKVIAGDCGDCNYPPTFPGNAILCTEEVPNLVVTYAPGMATIDSSHPVALSATGGSPPYTWSTSSLGYNLDKTLTTNDLEILTLSCLSGTCGTTYKVVATVTVTDICGKTSTVEIRNSSGKWANCYSFSQSCYSSCDCEGGSGNYLIIGSHRIYHRVCMRSYSGCANVPYSNTHTCSVDGWTYTFSSTNCNFPCGDTCVTPRAPWRKYIDYWTCQ